MGRFFTFGVALAVIAAILLRHVDLPPWATYAIAGAIVAAAYLFWPRRPKLKPGDPGTRKWARALYHNGMISIEELNRFYDEHPEPDEFESRVDTSNV